MHSQSSSPSLSQGSFVPCRDETTLEPMCTTRFEYGVPSMDHQEVIRSFRPMPIRHRVEAGRPFRQRNTSVAQLIAMFGNLNDQEEMMVNTSTSAHNDTFARRLAPFFSDESHAFGQNTDTDSPSVPVLSSWIPHHMIDWTRDVTVNASTLPKWETPQLARSTTYNDTDVEESCRETKRRKLPSERRQLVFVPRDSSRIESHRSGEDEPRKRRKRWNEV